MAVKKTTTKPAAKKLGKATKTKSTAAKAKPAAKKTPTKKATTKTAPAKPAAKKPVKPKKAVNKTQATKGSVTDFIQSITDEQKRKDSFTIIDMMEKITGDKAVMWGSSIIGFGDVTITSERSGRTVDWFKMGFSPRKANLTLYLSMGMQHIEAELKKLGKHKTGGGCLYINALKDVDLKVLQEMMKKSLKKGDHKIFG